MKPLVSIVLIGFNSQKFLKTCLGSVSQQTYTHLEKIFIDNASTDPNDHSCEEVERNFPDVKVIKNTHNSGYTGASNQGFHISKGEYVMILNPDIIMEPTYIEECVKAFERDQKMAAVTGKIYKYDFEHHRKTKFIDTVGLFSYRNRRVIDDGQGLEDQGQFDEPTETFGISGACPLYRRCALNEISIPLAGNKPTECWDEDFFMYKEDIDICWRLRLAGWKCWYQPTAVANHGRGTGVLKRFTHLEVAKNRSKLNAFQKGLSLRNQRLMQIKNELPANVLSDFFPIIWKEILVLGYTLLREPKLLKNWFQIFPLIPKMLKKRKFIMKHKKVTSQEMKKWLSGKQSKYLMSTLGKKK